VIGVTGPVFSGSIVYQLNINHWCPIREIDLQRDTGLPRIKLLNDFVANGFGMINIKEDEL
jgi:glucokinase